MTKGGVTCCRSLTRWRRSILLLTSLRPRAAGVVGVGAVTRLPSGDDVMKPWARQLVARLNIKHQRIWGANHAHQMEAFQTDEQITPIKRRTAAGRVRHRLGPLKTVGVEVRSSPGTSTSIRNPQPTPGHPHSTRKSHFSFLHQRCYS